MFKYIVKSVIALSIASFSCVGFGATAAKYEFSPDFIAENAVSFLNRYENTNAMLNDLKPFVDANDLKELQTRIESFGIKMTDKLPKFKSMGGDIITGDTKVTVMKDGRISADGRFYKLEGKRLADVFKEIAGEPKQKSAFHFSLFPEANAFVGPGMFKGMGKLVYAGLAALGVLAAEGVGGVVYFTKYAWEAWHDGQASCTPDGKFVARKQTSGTLGFPTNEDFILSAEIVSTITRRKVTKCDKVSLDDLQRDIRRMTVREVDKETYKAETGGGATK